MAQGVGSVLVGPLAALLHDETGSWLPVFAIIITMDALTGILALIALKPLRKNYAAKMTKDAVCRR
jgi:OFA family oxalate/formate antiporter-like MFS transporter